MFFKDSKYIRYDHTENLQVCPELRLSEINHDCGDTDEIKRFNDIFMFGLIGTKLVSGIGFINYIFDRAGVFGEDFPMHTYYKQKNAVNIFQNHIKDYFSLIEIQGLKMEAIKKCISAFPKDRPSMDLLVSMFETENRIAVYTPILI
jgi:hypothetical protein